MFSSIPQCTSQWFRNKPESPVLMKDLSRLWRTATSTHMSPVSFAASLSELLFDVDDDFPHDDNSDESQLEALAAVRSCVVAVVDLFVDSNGEPDSFIHEVLCAALPSLVLSHLYIDRDNRRSRHLAKDARLLLTTNKYSPFSSSVDWELRYDSMLREMVAAAASSSLLKEGVGDDDDIDNDKFHDDVADFSHHAGSQDSSVRTSNDNDNNSKFMIGVVPDNAYGAEFQAQVNNAKNIAVSSAAIPDGVKFANAYPPVPAAIPGKVDKINAAGNNQLSSKNNADVSNCLKTATSLKAAIGVESFDISSNVLQFESNILEALDQFPGSSDIVQGLFVWLHLSPAARRVAGVLPINSGASAVLKQLKQKFCSLASTRASAVAWARIEQRPQGEDTLAYSVRFRSAAKEQCAVLDINKFAASLRNPTSLEARLRIDSELILSARYPDFDQYVQLLINIESVLAKPKSVQAEVKEVCPFYLKGSCKYGVKCRFVHAKLRSSSSDKQNKQSSTSINAIGDVNAKKSNNWCRQFKFGRCSYGDRCIFRHDSDSDSNDNANGHSKNNNQNVNQDFSSSSHGGNQSSGGNQNRNNRSNNIRGNGSDNNSSGDKPAGSTSKNNSQPTGTLQNVNGTSGNGGNVAGSVSWPIQSMEIAMSGINAVPFCLQKLKPLPVAKITIAGECFDCLLDSGSLISAISAAAASKLGLGGNEINIPIKMANSVVDSSKSEVVINVQGNGVSKDIGFAVLQNLNHSVILGYSAILDLNLDIFAGKNDISTVMNCIGDGFINADFNEIEMSSVDTMFLSSSPAGDLRVDDLDSDVVNVLPSEFFTNDSQQWPSSVPFSLEGLSAAGPQPLCQSPGYRIELRKLTDDDVKDTSDQDYRFTLIWDVKSANNKVWNSSFLESRLSSDQFDRYKHERDEYLRLKLWYEGADPNAIGNVTGFPVVTEGRDPRCVLDFRMLNATFPASTSKPTCTQWAVKQLQSAIRAGDVVHQIDLSRAFLGVGICGTVNIICGNEVYHSDRMCFGMKPGPNGLECCLDLLVCLTSSSESIYGLESPEKVVNHSSVRIVRVMDDLLLIGDAACVAEWRRRFLFVLGRTGFTVQAKKEHLWSADSAVKWLGQHWQWDGQSMTMTRKLVNLEVSGSSKRHFFQLAGRILSVTMGFGESLARSLGDLVRRAAGSFSTIGWNESLPVNVVKLCSGYLNRAAQLLPRKEDLPLLSNVSSLRVCCDASDEGYGFIATDDRGTCIVTSSRLFSLSVNWHNNRRELFALARTASVISLMYLKFMFTGLAEITFASDNRVAVSNTTKTKAVEMLALSRLKNSISDCTRLLESKGVRTSIVHVAGSLNTEADRLSRPSSELSKSISISSMSAINVADDDSVLVKIMKSFNSNDDVSDLSSADIISLLSTEQKADTSLDKLFIDTENFMVDTNGILYKLVKNSTPARRCIVIPRSLVSVVLLIIHEQFTCHGTLKALRFHVSRSFYWAGMKSDCQKFVQNCSVCDAKRAPVVYYRACDIPQRQIDSKARCVWEFVSTDLVGPLAMCRVTQFRYVFSFICHHSRFCYLIGIRDVKSCTLASGLLMVCAIFGPMQFLVMDNQFNNRIFIAACRKLSIETIFCKPFSPFSNGLVERRNYDIKAALLRSTAESTSWGDRLASVMQNLNFRPIPGIDDSTAVTSAELFFRRPILSSAARILGADRIVDFENADKELAESRVIRTENSVAWNRGRRPPKIDSYVRLIRNPEKIFRVTACDNTTVSLVSPNGEIRQEHLRNIRPTVITSDPRNYGSG
jgi:hypothetical protein